MHLELFLRLKVSENSFQRPGKNGWNQEVMIQLSYGIQITDGVILTFQKQTLNTFPDRI